MALSFLKKPAAAPAQPSGLQQSAISGKLPGSTSAPTQTPNKHAAPNPANAGKVSAWMKKGSGAKAEMAKAEAKAEAAKAEAGKLWRFWMPADSERTITFLDGAIDDE